MPRSVHERAARRILRYGSTTPFPEHTQVVCDMIGYLENWATPERIAAGRAAAAVDAHGMGVSRSDLAIVAGAVEEE